MWVQADIYEYELPWVRLNDKAQMTLKSVPGRVFEGTVAYIYPYAEAKTRTIKVRLEFDNPELILKPDMFAEVTLNATPQENALVVPDEAIVRSGERELIFVVRALGKFEPREVRLGQNSGGWVQVLDGVKAGEEVVTSALFLIDSESKLQEATAKMLEAARAGSDTDDAQMDMGGMTLDNEMSMQGMQLESAEKNELDMAGMKLDEESQP